MRFDLGVEGWYGVSLMCTGGDRARQSAARGPFRGVTYSFCIHYRPWGVCVRKRLPAIIGFSLIMGAGKPSPYLYCVYAALSGGGACGGCNNEAIKRNIQPPAMRHRAYPPHRFLFDVYAPIYDGIVFRFMVGEWRIRNNRWLFLVACGKRHCSFPPPYLNGRGMVNAVI